MSEGFWAVIGLIAAFLAAVALVMLALAWNPL